MPSRPNGQTPLDHRPAVPFRYVVDPADWYAEDLAASGAYQFHFTEDHVAELDGAIRAVEHAKEPFRQITRENFSLTTLAPALAEIREEILYGCGGFIDDPKPEHRRRRISSATARWTRLNGPAASSARIRFSMFLSRPVER